MNGLMMDYPLTIPKILTRAERLFHAKTVVSQQSDKSRFRYTYGDMGRRTRRLMAALRGLGVRPTDRVATLCWNHHPHLEAYFAIPSIGAVLHTLNLRLHADDLAYIVGHAQDKLVLVDHSMLPLWEQVSKQVSVEKVVVIGGPAPAGMLDYEELLDAAGSAGEVEPAAELDEQAAAAMCYTSGTTGRPKGVLYSHRSMFLHSMMAAMTDALAIREPDVILPVVPMFHANAWGLPYAGAMVGATQVFPGPLLDPASLLPLMAEEKVTVTAGVPTIWLGMLAILDSQPGKYDLSALRSLVVGGSAAPLGLITGYRDRHGIRVVHAWGMTEMTPLGTISNPPARLAGAPLEQDDAYRAKQGTPASLVEVRARGENGLIDWDGQQVGELEVRGACVAAAYFNAPGSESSFTEDGWFRTGDMVSIDPHGCVEIKDRAKDVIKSGGEWISSVELENALMGHPAVAEAAVVAATHPKWQERPLAAVVLRPGQSADADELKRFLADRVAKWWIPDAVVFIDAIPKTATGKFLKTALRQRFHDYLLREPRPDSAT